MTRAWSREEKERALYELEQECTSSERIYEGLTGVRIQTFELLSRARKGLENYIEDLQEIGQYPEGISVYEEQRRMLAINEYTRFASDLRRFLDSGQYERISTASSRAALDGDLRILRNSYETILHYVWLRALRRVASYDARMLDAEDRIWASQRMARRRR